MPPPSPFEYGLCGLGLVALVAGAAFGRRGEDAAQVPVPWRQVGAVFAGAATFLIVRHHLGDPSWTPHAADWDSWYQSALALQGHLELYPPVRWPLYGAVGAALDMLLPGPLFRDLQVASLLACASAAAATFLVGERLIGRWAGLAAAVLALGFPLNLQHAGWVSGYPLWAAAVAWSVAGVAVAAAAHRWPSWILPGAALAAVLACEPKGIAPGGALLAVALPAALLRGQPRGRSLAALLAPILALAAAYAVFPPRLASLDAHATHAQHSREPLGTLRGVDMHAGYVFGQGCGPVTLARTLERVARGRPPSDDTGRGLLAANVAALLRSVQGASPWLALWLVLGAAAGAAEAVLRRAGRPQVPAWAALIAASAATLSCLWLHYTTRFLLPFFWIAPLLLVAPLALPLRRAPPWARWAPLLAVGLWFLPGAPGRPPPGYVDPVAVQASGDALRLYHALAATSDRAPLAVCTDPRTAWFALDARPGRYVTGPFDDRFPWTPTEPRAEEDLLLTPGRNPDGTPAPPACDPGTRPLLRTLATGEGPAMLHGPLPTPGS